MNDEFAFMILEIVREIPVGKVVSYSRLADLAGYPRNARQVGKVLSHADYFGRYPCHRVLHADGSLVAGWEEQRVLLEAEGVEFKPNGKVDLRRFSWNG